MPSAIENTDPIIVEGQIQKYDRNNGPYNKKACAFLRQELADTKAYSEQYPGNTLFKGPVLDSVDQRFVKILQDTMALESHLVDFIGWGTMFPFLSKTECTLFDDYSLEYLKNFCLDLSSQIRENLASRKARGGTQTTLANKNYSLAADEGQDSAADTNTDDDPLAKSWETISTATYEFLRAEWETDFLEESAKIWAKAHTWFKEQEDYKKRRRLPYYSTTRHYPVGTFRYPPEFLTDWQHAKEKRAGSMASGH
ncbi:hypothetical protein F4808DRAFT_258406 [Astrocystis sublimbata]|nr:hypothetical protein F4808DRAFT_258406 [Astrocystis sublimbata]